jgi:hypothetical protein
MADLAPAFALHALDEDLAEAVQHHRTACPTCARQLDEAERTAALLPYLVKPSAPAPDIKAALFTRIAQSQALNQAAQDRPVAPLPALPTTIPASHGGLPEERVARSARRGWRLPALGALRRPRGETATSGGRPTTDEAGRGPWGNWPGPALPVTTTTVPLMLVLVVLGGWAMTLYNRASEAAAYQDLWGEVDTVLSSEDGTVFELQREADVPESVTGRVIADPKSDQALLVVFGLNPKVGDGNYQVWIERGGVQEPVGEIDVNRRGDGREMIRLGSSLEECRSVIVRVETRNASGEPVYVDILSTAITPDGPASGGNGAQGDQSIGSAPTASRTESN